MELNKLKPGISFNLKNVTDPMNKTLLIYICEAFQLLYEHSATQNLTVMF